MYPPAPWTMHGQMWMSLFRVREGERSGHPPGVYGAGLVHYEHPSPLTYSELLVGRAVKKPIKGVTITDIWVDDADSVAGGRELWAIPKELCEFTYGTSSRGPISRTSWSASLHGRPIVEAHFTDVARAAPRLPFRGDVWQPGILGGEDKQASLQGSGKSLACRGRWQFDSSGPLGWLSGKRPLASFRMHDFTMTFG